MDTGAIFAEVARRNALRVANGLPPLDVPAEYAREVTAAKRRDFRVFCDLYLADQEAIRLEVLAELRAKHGPNFGRTMGSRWAVGHLTRQRFSAYITDKYSSAVRARSSETTR